MLELLRTWLLGVILASMVVAAANGLMPEGPVKRAGRLAGGLVLILALLQPLARPEISGLIPPVVPLVPTERTEDGGETAIFNSMQDVIEEETSAYAMGKGKELGASPDVRIGCRAGGGGIPVPWQAEIRGSLTEGQKADLTQWIAEELRIPAERQYYDTEAEE